MARANTFWGLYTHVNPVKLFLNIVKIKTKEDTYGRSYVPHHLVNWNHFHTKDFNINRQSHFTENKNRNEQVTAMSN